MTDAIIDARGGPAEPVPWQQSAWIGAASDWIRREARSAGIGRVVGIVPHKVTDRSVVLTAETASERLFFKAGLRARHEPALTALLSRSHPGRVPDVVAVDPIRSWILMREVRGRLLVLTADVSVWQHALEALAQIQRDYVDRIDELLEVGCRHGTMTSLAEQIGELGERCARDGELTVDERGQVRRSLPAWQQLCATGSTGRLPDATIDHGDLHPHNVVVTGHGPVYLDWEAAGIAHPFLAPATLLGYMEHLVPDLSRAREVLRDSYLNPWRAFLPMLELVSMFERLRTIASLRYAIRLSQAIASGRVHPGEQMDRLRATIAHCLRTALVSLDSGAGARLPS